MYKIGSQVVRDVFSHLDHKYKLLTTKSDIKFILSKLFEYYEKGTDRMTASDVDYIYSEAKRNRKPASQAAIHAVITAYEDSSDKF